VSLPPWERGLKSSPSALPHCQASVAPPLGAWIEIEMTGIVADVLPSLPPWERGLKYEIFDNK